MIFLCLNVMLEQPEAERSPVVNSVDTFPLQAGGNTRTYLLSSCIQKAAVDRVVQKAGVKKTIHESLARIFLFGALIETKGNDQIWDIYFPSWSKSTAYTLGGMNTGFTTTSSSSANLVE